MQSNSKYLEKSLNGQWVALARDWLDEHAPCSLRDYLSAVSPLMPTHIIRNGRREPQVALARSSLRRIGVRVENGIISKPAPRRNSSGKCFTALLREAANRGEILDAGKIDWAGRNAGSLCCQLMKRGELVRIAPRKYVKAERGAG